MTVGQIIAPGWSELLDVGAKMVSTASNINGHFSATAIIDLDTTITPSLATIRAAKETYTSPQAVVC